MSIPVDIAPCDGGYCIYIPEQRYGKIFTLEVGTFPTIDDAKKRISKSRTMRLGTIHTTNPADKQP